MAVLHAFPKSPVRNERGLTLIELMVAFAIFAILLAAMVSFYRFQSSVIAGSSKRKTAHEVTTAALASIRSDIMQAGTGLRGTLSQAGSGTRSQSHLAVFVQYHDPTRPQDPDALYLNSTDYLDMSLPQGTSFPNSFFSDTAVPGIGKSWFEFDPGDVEKYVDNVHANVGPAAMDRAIVIPDAPGQAYLESLTVSAYNDDIDPQKNTQKLKLTFGSTTGGTVRRYATPAISYRLSLLDTNVNERGRLLRNGETMIGGAMQVGQIPSVKVTDFKIRCQFRDLASASGTTWAQLDPNPGGTYTADRLLLIEVTVRYLVRDMQGGYATPNDGPSGFRIEGDTTHGPWMTGGTRTITVSPRCLVLMQYL
ncbi:MAG: prepilin-type N-terminal cleavage/methylation domain-containing protein [Desulfomonilaceae bacterium]|nr:prepilin-type N-terminal cleavage/methylation domain-containing protein [Desulfomonilaceae bacterium]